MFYALWIPCLTQTQPMIVKNVNKKTLKDVKEFDACRFRSSINPKSYDITIQYSLTEWQPFKKITFECLHRTHSGMIVLRLDLDSETGDNVKDNLRNGMHPSIYHLIKDHFHCHRFHDDECDTLLKPYSSHREINISNQSTMKDVYTFYLEQYRKKLQGALTDLTAQYAHLKDLEKKDWYGSCLTEAKRIKEICDQTVGEAAYAKALLNMSRATVRTQIYESLTSLTIDVTIQRKQNM